MVEFILGRANYWAIIALMMVGLYITFQSTNLIKRLVGLSVFQTSVFLFYITLGKVAGGSAPILFGADAHGHGGGHEGNHGSDSHDDHGQVVAPTAELNPLQEFGDEEVEAEAHGDAIDLPTVSDFPGSEQLQLTGLNEVYSNPLPHVLILTAIVVGVATLSVGLAIVVRIRECYGSIESDEIREKDIEIADAQDADDPVIAGGA